MTKYQQWLGILLLLGGCAVAADRSTSGTGTQPVAEAPDCTSGRPLCGDELASCPQAGTAPACSSDGMTALCVKPDAEVTAGVPYCGDSPPHPAPEWQAVAAVCEADGENPTCYYEDFTRTQATCADPESVPVCAGGRAVCAIEEYLDTLPLGEIITGEPACAGRVRQ